MTNTSKAVDRYNLYSHGVRISDDGVWVSYSDYAALAAQLEAANARAARARDDALAEAADVVCGDTQNLDTWTRGFVRNALISLRTQSSSSVEPVTAQIMADPRVQALVEALERIEELEAKLHKAVGALGDIGDGEPEWPNDPQKELDWCRSRANKALAKLKEPKP